MRLIVLKILVLLAIPAAAGAQARVDCAAGPAAAAAVNAASLESLDWAPFRRPERGWAIYATRIAAEIGTACPAVSPGFAGALAQWQARAGLVSTGVLDVESFAAMNGKWTLARPFVVATRDGSCPAAPADDRLATAAVSESYGGKTIQLRADALAAYRRMAGAARRSIKAADPQWFTIVSGFRAPLDDDVRCLIDGDCQGVTRAACSSHRTGLAIDLHVGAAPGFGPDSSDDTNRRAMVHTLAYRWLVAHAGRFGFINYVFEPWHWEWSPPKPARALPPTAFRPMVPSRPKG